MSATLTGDWKGIERKLASLGSDLDDALEVATEQNAQETRTALVMHIQNQDLGWTELDPAYVRAKESKSLSNQTLIATGTLLSSITVYKKDKFSAFVGALRSAGSRNATWFIAPIMEFGSPKRNIPARPLFRPTFKEMKRKMIERYEKAIEKVLNTKK